MGGNPFDALEVGRSAGLRRQSLLEPGFHLRLLGGNLPSADIEDLLGIERADLSGIGQPLPGCGAEMQHFEAGSEIAREAEGGLRARIGRSLPARGQENLDELGAQGVDPSRPLRLRI